MKCNLFVSSDFVICETCRIAWDRNDPYPPECGNNPPAKRGNVIAVLFLALIVETAIIIWLMVK